MKITFWLNHVVKVTKKKLGCEMRCKQYEIDTLTNNPFVSIRN